MNLFYEASITLIPPKPNKDNTKNKNKKQQTNFSHEIDAKILNKELGNIIQQYVKRIIYHDKVMMKRWLDI